MTIAENTNEAGSEELSAKLLNEQRPAERDRVRVWDIAVRLFHWSLVVSYTIAWITADEWDDLHETFGYVVGGLIAFRLIWGIIGSKHARFGDFVYGPMAIARYLRDVLYHKPKRYLGHNPAGGAMIIALLLSVTVVTATGIAMTMDAYWGVEWVEDVHEASAILTLFLVGFHVTGVIVSSFLHRENLVRAMITGYKQRTVDK